MTSFNTYVLQHRLPALAAAFLQSTALALTIYSGNTCQFLKVTYDDPHSPLDGENFIEDEQVLIDDQTTFHRTVLSDNHDIGLFCDSESFPNKDDSMWNISRAFLIGSYVLLGLGTLLAWGLSTIIRPTPKNWQALSVLSILTACIETPVFLFATIEPCQSYEGQTCNVGKGFFMHLWSVITLIFLTVFTQVHDCPQWWDVSMEWKIDKKREQFGEGEYDSLPYDNLDNGPSLWSSKTDGEYKRNIRRNFFISRWFAFTTFIRFGTNIKHTAITEEEMEENDEEIGCSSCDSNERINALSPLAVISNSHDIERLMLQMTPDGKEVGDDRQSQYSFDLNIDEHMDSPTQSSSHLLPMKGSDDALTKSLDFSNIPIQERRDTDESCPQQFSHSMPESSDQLDLSHRQEVATNTENAESFYSAHGNLSDNDNATGLEEKEEESRIDLEYQHFPVQDLGEKFKNTAIQFSPARRAAIGEPVKRHENLALSESLKIGSKPPCLPKQDEKRNEVPTEVDQIPQELNGQAKLGGSTEDTPSLNVVECIDIPEEDKEDSPQIITQVLREYRSPLELAVLTGLNEAAKSNTSCDDEPEPIYYSSDDQSLSSSLSNSSDSSANLGNRQEIDLPSWSDSDIIQLETNSKCDKNKSHRSHKRRKRRRKSSRSICSKVSLLSMTIDEETDLDIENEDKSASLSGTNYETTDEVITIGGNSNEEGPNVISPMNDFPSHLPSESSYLNYYTESSRSSYYSSDSSGYCTGNSSYGRVMKVNIQSESKSTSAYCTGNSSYGRDLKVKIQSESKSTSALPVVSPTSHDINAENKFEGKSSFPSDIFLDNIYLSENDDDPTSCLSSVSTQARTARKRRLKRSVSRSTTRKEPDLLRKEDIITSHAIVQSYASDEASL